MQCHRKFRYYSFFFILALCAFFYSTKRLYSQSSSERIDSIQRVLEFGKDTNAVYISFKLGRELWFARDIPSAIIFLKKSIELSDKMQYFNYASDTRLLLANAYINLEKFDSVYYLLQKAMYWALQLKQKEHIPKIDLTYSYFYNLIGDHHKALSYGLLAAEGFEKIEVPEINMQSVYAWLEVGHIFRDEQQYDKALQYYFKALVKSRKSNQNWYMRPAMVNVANMYIKKNELTKASNLFKEVVKTDREDNGVDYVTSGLSGLGDIAMIEKKYVLAIDNYKEALVLCYKHNMKTNIDDYHSKTGYAYFMNNQLDSAKLYLIEGLRLSRVSQDLKMIGETCSHLSEVYAHERRYLPALQYYRLYKDAADTLYNNEKVRSLNRLEILYETNKKEKQILALQTDNTKKELQLSKQSRWLLVTFIILGLISIIFFLFYHNSMKNRMINRQRQQLQEQKISSLEREQEVIALRSMLSGQEAERTRIAKDLHDGLSGLFSTVKMHLSTLVSKHESLKQDGVFNKSFRLLDMASEDLSRIAHNMMPEALLKLGLIHALKDFCNSVNAIDSLQVSLLSYGMEERLGSNTEIVLYRIVQELLNNIVKHAKAREAIVQFNRTKNHITLIVEDDGCGFAQPNVDGKLHAGMDIIKGRVKYLGGTISIDSEKGVGTTVMVSFIINNKEKV